MTKRVDAVRRAKSGRGLASSFLYNYGYYRKKKGQLPQGQIPKALTGHLGAFYEKVLADKKHRFYTSLSDLEEPSKVRFLQIKKGTILQKTLCRVRGKYDTVALYPSPLSVHQNSSGSFHRKTIQGALN